MAVGNRSKAGELIELAEDILSRTERAKAICALATLAEKHMDELPGDNTVSKAMYAAYDLLREAESMAVKIIQVAQRPESKEAANG